MKKIICITSILCLISIGCEEPPVVFVSPQPAGQDAENIIDMIYHGTFLCESDSAIVHIRNKIIYKEKAFAFTLTLEEIAEMEEVTLVSDQLVVEDWPDPLPAKVIDDKVYSSIILQDTLFQMGPDQVLKKFRGHQILNKKISNKKWEVLILSLDTDLNLRLSQAELPADFERLVNLTTVKDISTEEQTQLLLSPTILEFEEILRQRLIFQECDVFSRAPITLQI